MANFQERRYNNGEILARRSSQGGGESVKLEDFIKMVTEMGVGLVEPIIDFEYEPPEYGGFADFVIEISGKEAQ